MSETVIEVQNLSKVYRLGEVGTGTLSRDLERWYAKARGKEDPFSVIGNGNIPVSIKPDETVYSLKDVNLTVQQGDRLGIIGSNGAGKSTLLKLLSRITTPTSGNIKLKGKMASLLEVGTGFHPELTGRENIFLNGAILGMRKKEIARHLPEIIDFSGVEQYIDTPVKRYSSGMYVRLAFAVAAHLEPDILVIDEVLAVGDAEFQKKCLGKMNEVSARQGRTILFVSHNMQAVNNLCSKAIWLKHGSIEASGSVREVVNRYLRGSQQQMLRKDFNDVQLAPGNSFIKVTSVELIPHLAEPYAPIDVRTPLTVRFKFINYSENINLLTSLLLFSFSGECIFDIASKPSIVSKGLVDGYCEIPGNFLNDGAYYFSLYFVKDTTAPLFEYEKCLEFDVADHRENFNWYGKWWGHVRPNFPLTLTPESK